MKLKHALLNNKLVHIDKVSNGSKCGCICPYCKDDLIAKNKGKIKQHHFAHKSTIDCKHGYETSLHLLAKEVLKNEKSILIPMLFATHKDKQFNFHISSQKELKLKHVYLEEKLSNIIPDVCAIDIDDNIILIEIKVTHGIDAEKLDKIRKLDITTLEIDLSDGIVQSYEQMASIMKTSLDRKIWIYNKEAESISKYLMNISEKKQINYKRNSSDITDCPLEKVQLHNTSHFDITHDCNNCPYNMLYDYYDNFLYCTGKTKISKIDDFSNVINVQKNKEFIETVYFSDGIIKSFSKTLKNSLSNLWNLNNHKPFLASNQFSGISVFISSDPYIQMEKYHNCYGKIYKYGRLIADKIIFGATKYQWEIIQKK